jgi:endonuclease YncB( thermonuclease family)
MPRASVWVCFVVLMAARIFCADAPDGTVYEHKVLGVDQADAVRIRYCGAPLQVRLANISYKGEQSQADALRYLRESLKGKAVRIELEADQNGDDALAPMAQVFVGGSHVNIELVKRGLALSDARSKKYGSNLQTAQMEATTKRLGIWASAPVVAVAPAKAKDPVGEFIAVPDRKVDAAKVVPPPVVDLAPREYTGPVVADLNGREYHFPMSRYAQNIRPGARIEYKSPAEAERAGKAPSPFSFPERANEFAAKMQKASGAAKAEDVVGAAKTAYSEALTYMQEARKLSRTDTKAANVNWKKAAKILAEHIDKVTPIADSRPSDKDLQKLTEEMSMSLYSCNKYQSL